MSGFIPPTPLHVRVRDRGFLPLKSLKAKLALGSGRHSRWKGPSEVSSIPLGASARERDRRDPAGWLPPLGASSESPKAELLGLQLSSFPCVPIPSSPTPAKSPFLLLLLLGSSDPDKRGELPPSACVPWCVGSC